MSDNIYFERGEAPKEIRYSEEFALHLDRMTVEKLHSKSHIALELARRDIENTRLKERLEELEEEAKRYREIQSIFESGQFVDADEMLDAINGHVL